MASGEERLPPQNLEAEQSVLGSMLIDKDAAIYCADFLDPEDFYRDAHRVIFARMLEMLDKGEPTDLVTVSDKLRATGELEKVGGVSFLGMLANFVPTAANVEYYARIVKEKAVLRRLISAATEIAASAYSAQTDVDEILDKAEQAIFEVAQKRPGNTCIPLKDVLVETMEHLEHLSRKPGGTIGLATGLKDLDRITSGFQQSDLIILAARPSVGKTSLALNIARNVALKEDVPVVFFSLEMSREQVAQRLLCAEANIDSQRLRGGFLDDDEWRRLSVALGRLAEAKIYIDDTPSLSTMELRSRCRRLKSQTGLGLVIVDYLQLMRPSRRGENRQQEISEISRSLKSLAREINVPVLAMSQLSRAVEQRQDRRPLLSDLRESGAIEQDADVVLFLYTDPEMENQNIIELIVAKQRNGPTSSTRLFYSRETCRFEDLDVMHA
ncbi:MAG: replicative DNA helicase [Firmicutes bacterium]|nr:replicative DNA helicase [Candidatus Fermentithermobacillaceae bacterium]